MPPIFFFSENVTVSNITVEGAQTSISIFQGTNSVTISDVTILGNGAGTGLAAVTDTKPNWWQTVFGIYEAPILLNISGTWDISEVEIGFLINDGLPSPNSITINSDETTVLHNNMDVGIRRTNEGSVVGLSEFAADIGFNNHTSGTPEEYNP